MFGKRGSYRAPDEKAIQLDGHIPPARSEEEEEEEEEERLL